MLTATSPAPTAVDADLIERASRSYLSIPVLRLLRVLAAIVRPRMAYAVGGGIAVGVAGFVRATRDVDVFARPFAAKQITRSLRAAGLTIKGLTDAHIIAYFQDDNRESLDRREMPETRIDLLVTVTEPESTAIRTGQPQELAGLTLVFMRPNELATLKFLAGRPQDLVDLDALVLSGAVDVEKVKYLIAVSENDEAAVRFAARVHEIRRPASKGRYVSPAEMRALFAGQPVTPAKDTGGAAGRRPRS